MDNEKPIQIYDRRFRKESKDKTMLFYVHSSYSKVPGQPQPQPPGGCETGFEAIM